jgi:hypothetical protein
MTAIAIAINDKAKLKTCTNKILSISVTINLSVENGQLGYVYIHAHSIKNMMILVNNI